jgi:hypothetical protein
MKNHLIAFLETRPEDEISKLLNWAYTQAYRLDDRTPFENRVFDTIKTAIYHNERPK